MTQPTSVCCRCAERPRAARAGSGFTLLELLLVLALLGLMVAVVAPRLWAGVAGAEQRAALDRLSDHLERQGGVAFHSRTRLLANDEELAKLLPQGWRLELAQPLHWEANGMAQGGRLRVWQGQGLLADWVLTPPLGLVRAETPLDGSFAPDATRPATPGLLMQAQAPEPGERGVPPASRPWP